MRMTLPSQTVAIHKHGLYWNPLSKHYRLTSTLAELFFCLFHGQETTVLFMDGI